ncbi:MAG: RNA polymerase sigma factor, partial [Rikenellaceae bacterium]
TWIYAVSQRYIFDLNRRKKSISKSDNVNIELVEDALSDEDNGGNFMGVENYREHYNDAILSALDQLAPIHKEALLLQQAGYKVDEIVEISYQNGNLKSKNCDTIKSRIFLAKKGMQKLITRDGDAKRD